MAKGKGYTRWVGFIAILLMVSALGVGGAWAQYPDKPISMIVTYSPGGATDFQARIVTKLASDEK